MIEYLERNIGLEGVVWVDILACDQNAIAAGDMGEIKQLPHCIEFIGQTYVMPGTLSRLWCIFEMAYSLFHNQQLIYYDEPAGDDAMVSELLLKDQQQLSLSSRKLLESASCWKATDRAFIEHTLRRSFDSPADAVDTIKVFVQSRLRTTTTGADTLPVPPLSVERPRDRLNLRRLFHVARETDHYEHRYRATITKLQQLQKPLLQDAGSATGVSSCFYDRL